MEEEVTGSQSWVVAGEGRSPVVKGPARSLPEPAGEELGLPFTRGSYRKYMNHLIRGNSDTEITNDRPFLADRVRPKSAVFVRDQLRQAQHTSPRFVSTLAIDSGLSRLKTLDGSNDTLHNSEENVFATGCTANVFSPARRAVCSWSGRRQSASACSDMTASTETLVGRDDSWDDNTAERTPEAAVASAGSVVEPEVRVRRTGAVTTSGCPEDIDPPGTSRVEALIHRYTQLIRRHMERSATKPARKSVRSSLPNLETDSSKIDIAKKEKLCKKLKRFSLSLEKEAMGGSHSTSAVTSPTYLALPTFRKNKRKSSGSPSSVSDEGCSEPSPALSNSPLSPASSEEEHVWSASTVEEEPLKRCQSSDSAVECVGSEDEDSPVSRTRPVSIGEEVIASIDIPPRAETPEEELASSSKTYLLDEVLSERSDIELRSDRWFIEHYGSSVLEKLNDRGKTETWIAEVGEVNLDRRMSEVDSIDGIDPGTERRESNLSYFTDDDEHPGYRYFRTPSVVVSDHSDDPAYASSTITLEEIERFRKEYAERQNSIGDSSSDCSVTSSWSNVYSTISALDAEFVLRSPERKASDCSSCSTLSGDEESTEQILQDVRNVDKVGCSLK